MRTSSLSFGHRQEELEPHVPSQKCDIDGITVEVWWDSLHNSGDVQDGYRRFRRHSSSV